MKFLEPPGFIIVHRTKEIENCPRRCILPGIHEYFYTKPRGIFEKRRYCARERKSSVVIFTCVLDSGSWLSLTLNGLVVSDLTSGEDVLQLGDFTLIPCILAGHWNHRAHLFNRTPSKEMD